MDRHRASECYRVFAELNQHRCESTYEYFERFRWYMDEYPNHGLQFHELLKHFLNGMHLKEIKILDTMAGGSLWDRTPTEVWYLIQDRAAETRPYTQYIYSQQSLEENAHQLALARKAAAIAYYKAELDAEMAELERKLEEINKNKRELKSAPKPTRFSPDNEEKIPSIKEQADEDIMEEESGVDEDIMEEESGVDEDIMEEELQVVPIMSTADVPTECISPQCSDIIIEQNMVIACNPIIPLISDLAISYNVQNDTIKKALRNNQVWGSLEKVTIHIPMVRTPMITLKSEQFLNIFCINWKTHKKDRRGSLGKVASHSHMAWARKQTPKLVKLPEGLHRTWKRQKKVKCTFVDKEYSMFSVYMQNSRSTFGWKPGWNSWRSVSPKLTRNVRRGVRKFDGVHPWAPNLC